MRPTSLGLVLRVALGGVFVLAAGACRPTPSSTDRLVVVASAYPEYFLAAHVGGDRADVVNLTPAGTEPHDYEPTARDIALIDRANLLVLNGGGFETWGDKVRENLVAQQTVVVTASQGLLMRQVVEEGEPVIDPHVWLSPALAQQMVDRVTAGFRQTDPAHTGIYESNASALKAKLSALDTAFHHGLAHCASHDIATSHAAFGYLAASYGLNQVSIAGLTPDAEPSPRQLAQLVQFARQHQVTTIFFERLVSPKLSETLAAEVGAKTMVLDPIEGLTKDDLAAGKNYFTLMQQNLANLETALQCTP